MLNSNVFAVINTDDDLRTNFLNMNMLAGSVTNFTQLGSNFGSNIVKEQSN